MKYLMIICLSLLTLQVSAQEDSSYVEVTYELTLDMDADDVIASIPQQFRAAVEDQVRQEMADGVKVNYILKTNGKESTYIMQERINNSQGAGGLITQQIMSQDKGVFYKNLDEETFLKPYDIMGSRYLVKDKLPDYTWTLSREKEQIAGFDTRKATGQYNDTIAITSWYAPKLAFKDGPDRAWGLPGLILKSKFETNGMGFLITAISVAVKDETIDIKKPSGTKYYTQEEFEAEMKRIQKQFEEMMSDGVDTE